MHKISKLGDADRGIAAIYARYSTADQKDSSIEDQVRRCREIAARHGAIVPDSLVFMDAAVSGSEKGRLKRIGFDELLAAIESGGFFLLVVDELSRLARDVLELAKFDKLIARKRLRVVTADGLDSTSPTWTLQLSIIGAMAQFSLKETKHRVIRGMQGQLERGWMIAAPPYGYRAVQELDATGKALGTSWCIQPEEAEIVREIFKLRSHGQAYGQIAKSLNAKCIAPSSRQRQRTQNQMWLMPAIYRLISNPIFKGIFIYHASPTYLSQQAETGLEAEAPTVYPRPQLALVSESLWAICNAGKISRTGYGGGRHLLAGLVTCGHCHGILNVSSPEHGTRTLTCALCNQEKFIGIRTQTVGYVSVTGVSYLLETLIKTALGEEFRAGFASRLKAKLAGGHAAELKSARETLMRAERQCQRLANNLGQIAEDDPYLLEQYKNARDTRLENERSVKRLEEAMVPIDTKALELQLSVDPATVIGLLFSENTLPVERKRAILSRLFPRIVMLGKGGARQTTLFEVDMIPGGIAAELTQTGLLVDEVVRYRLALKTSGKRPTVWEVEFLANNEVSIAA